jgi:isopentenyl diphosphate isomerase/L-lactate dehydrogenase-like FMN-dependent dehydrogenase
LSRKRAPISIATIDYLIGGSETETTLARNRLALDAIGFRPRVLRDVSNVNCSSSLFRKKLRIPVLCAPVGSLQVFDPGGGATVAEATRTFGNGMILSSVSELGLDKTAEAAGDGFTIFQIYVRGDAQWVDDHVRRAIDRGYNAFCLTVDIGSYSRRARHRQTPPTSASACRRRPHFPGAIQLA